VINLHVPVQFPEWVTWATIGAAISSIPAWIGLYISVRKHRAERSILKFTLRATNVEADEDEMTRSYFDGTPVVPALWVTVTNMGKQPLTLFEVKCKYAGVGKDGKSFERVSSDCVNKKLGEADHCFAAPHVSSKATKVISVWAVDSTGRQWKIPRRSIRNLNNSGLKGWK
jgi:hypothetical protein